MKLSEKKLKRSNAPIFWLMFGGGGMLSALTGPVLLFVTGVAVPLGILAPELLSYQHAQAFAQNIVGKLIIFVVVFLYLWHAAHRIFKSLHDVGIHPSPVSKAACYGTAFVCTLILLYGMIAVGFLSRLQNSASDIN
jgi:fumarate reductase subunit D